MKSYIWVAFAFMGWTYYEMSGGSDFVPEARPEVAQAPSVDEPQEEIVARADTTVLQSISTSNVAASPETEAVAEPVTLASADATTGFSEDEVTAALEDALALQSSEDVQPPADELTGRMADILTPRANPLTGDIRAVSGSRVNMRTGPGTNFGVIDTLTGGTQVEVLEVQANGWARLIHLDTGAEGWMAERLLTDPS